MNDDVFGTVIPPVVSWGGVSRSDVGNLLDPSEPELTRGNIEAIRTVADVAASMSPAHLRKAASLVIRCQECEGRAVATVTWVRGRPLYIGAHDRGRAMVSLLDEPVFCWPYYRCSGGMWRFVFVEDVPLPGEDRRVLRLTHGDMYSAVLH